VRSGVRPLVLLGSLFFAAAALAAPDEAALGKAEGYPICPPSPRIETRCLVGLVSRYDEIFPSRKVAKGTQPRPLKRAAAEPAIRYTYQSESSGLDDYLSRYRTTGLLILKDDTILAERYQFDRTPEQRMASYSMAKTIVGMLVGVALAERTIQSLDDHAEQYVAELKGTPYGETPIRHLLTMSSGVLAEYLSETIWQPMGAEADASWIIDKGGYEVAHCCVNATVRDYARLGMLLANDGALDGRQIIPARWVRAATAPPAKQFQPGQTDVFLGYGYQTWIVPGKEREFVLRGLRGQSVFVAPASKVVMVHTAAGDVSDQGFGERITLWSAVVKSSVSLPAGKP
jgi:CubicO group peptidase (beta-lactamase class C family)